MQLALPPSRPFGPADHRQANLFLALMFWAFTYVLFTYRANLRYGDAYELISAIRLLPTMVGAGLYWLVLSRLIDNASDRPGKPLVVVGTLLPASIVVLLARVLLDQFGAPNPNGFPGDLRFVMVWGGYFGLWVSASFLLRTMPGAAAAPTSYAPVRRQEAVRSQVSAPAVNAVDRLTLAIADLPERDRIALLSKFGVVGPYEAADGYERR